MVSSSRPARLAALVALALTVLSGCDGAGPDALDSASSAGPDTADAWSCDALASLPKRTAIGGQVVVPSPSASADARTVARWVGNDLYLEVAWPSNARLEINAGFIVRDARPSGAILPMREVEVLMLQHFDSERMWAYPLEGERYPINGCISVKEVAGETQIDIQLAAVLFKSHTSGVQHELEIADHLTVIAPDRSVYANECSSARAMYLPLDLKALGAVTGDFGSWSSVEGDCWQDRDEGCRDLSWPMCGESGLRCESCFNDVCIRASIWNTCLPEWRPPGT